MGVDDERKKWDMAKHNNGEEAAWARLNMLKLVHST